MLSAATMTIRPMVMPIATFSSQRAENRLWFMTIQLVVRYPSPSRASTEAATSRTA